ncbi:Hypothetical Protein FCC1311_085932 [Hondaea fermentalgiana]|uniref:Uncharacterized protein n=1 Tax=Hondaea fermentalgiana TaxID=2315210 RepID=A0A2R5GRH6_9STRA|nr:Hypothetical Protein FCC1311_085932 [Hondaea fermentalgiana]|eukprot:GBG32368.1 Hypothetical Protein FCC1311_085932 [Hondaea fermentalgiana]
MEGARPCKRVRRQVDRFQATEAVVTDAEPGADMSEEELRARLVAQRRADKLIDRSQDFIWCPRCPEEKIFVECDGSTRPCPGCREGAAVNDQGYVRDGFIADSDEEEECAESSSGDEVSEGWSSSEESEDSESVPLESDEDESANGAFSDYDDLSPDED